MLSSNTADFLRFLTFRQYFLFLLENVMSHSENTLFNSLVCKRCFIMLLYKRFWEMGEICRKTKSYSPLIKEKLISTPYHIMIILRLHPPSPPSLEKKSPPIDSLVPSLLVGFLPPVQISLQMTLRRMPKSHLKSHQNQWTLSLCRLRKNWEIPHLWH